MVLTSMMNCCLGANERKKSHVFESLQEEEHTSAEQEKLVHLHAMLAFKSQRRERRTVLCQCEIDDDFQAPSYPKSDETYRFIDDVLGDNFIFATMTEDERRLLIDAMQPDEVKAGTDIIVQGDERGDFFYVLETGTVDVVVEGAVVETFDGAKSFGELALLYHEPRTATCRATSDCKLWKLDQLTFRLMFAKKVRDDTQDVSSLLKDVPMLKDLDAKKLAMFAEALTPVTFDEGERIFNKGDVGEVFYVVKTGQVRLHDIGAGDAQYSDKIVGPGEAFGDRGLMTGEPRFSNATATTETVTTLCLSHDTFEKTFGKLDLHRNNELRRRDLMCVPLFQDSHFEPYEVEELVDCISEECHRKGDILMERGKPIVHDLYMIRYGRVLVSNEDGTLNTLKTGDYFGDSTITQEEGTLSDRTITCEENSCFGILSKRDIQKVIRHLSRLGDPTPFASSKLVKTIKFRDLKRHKLLGQGAFGKVWLVSNKATGTPYALKELNKKQLLQSNQVKTLMREKTVMAGVEHPFILNLISTYQDEKKLYMLIELVLGGELFSVIHTKRGSGIPNDDAAFYGACILEALGHLHKRSICYRDLKGENVLINARGYCVVVDLGFAKVVLDKTYTLCGTPEYLAPEVIMSRGHDKGVDYWSLGCLIYEMLVGSTPFYVRGESQLQMFKKIVLAKYPCPEKKVNEESKDLISRLLKSNQTQRLGRLAGGYMDVRRHDWFEDINFKKILRQEMAAPWVPQFKDPLDASHFDQIDEEKELSTSFLTDEEQEIFKEF